MPKPLTRPTGIKPGARPRPAPRHRSITLVELIITAALALSTAVAVTAVSIGMARADVVGAMTSGDGTRSRSRFASPFCSPPWAGLPSSSLPTRGATDHRFGRPVGGSHCRASSDARQCCCWASHSGLMLAALMIGHQVSISAL